MRDQGADNDSAHRMCQMPPTETETYHTANLLGVQLKVSSTDTLAQTLASLAGDQRSIRFIRCRNTESRSDFSMCGAPLFNCVSHEFYTPFFLVSSGRVRSSRSLRCATQIAANGTFVRFRCRTQTVASLGKLKRSNRSGPQSPAILISLSRQQVFCRANCACTLLVV